MTDPTEKVLKARYAHGSRVEAEAVVSHDVLHFLRTFDTSTGKGHNRDHDLNGKSIVGKVLVFPNPTTGASNAGAFLELHRNHTAPVAILANSIDNTSVSGFILAGASFMSEFEGVDITQEIQDGDLVVVDPTTKSVTVRRA
jgi:predicted aconitase with swiveling domain